MGNSLLSPLENKVAEIHMLQRKMSPAVAWQKLDTAVDAIREEIDETES